MEEALTLRLTGIYKEFRNDLFKPRYLALDDLSHTFPAAAITAIMGHNGAGKTTMMRVIMGLVHAERGTVLLNGRKLCASDRHYLGYMPENDHLPRDLSSVELLGYQLRRFRPRWTAEYRRTLIAAALSETELTEHSKKRIKTLSKGLLRRLAWALATVHRPRLLILDEPFSGLDPLGQFAIKRAILRARAKGVTVLLSTHSWEKVSDIGERLVILNGGRKVYDGPGPEDMTQYLALFKSLLAPRKVW